MTSSEHSSDSSSEGRGRDFGSRSSAHVTAARRLEGIVASLRNIGLIVTIFGITTLLSVLAAIVITPAIPDVAVPLSLRPRIQTVLWVSLLPATTGILTLIFALRHDSLRRSGDAIFSELSDELQIRRASRGDVDRNEGNPETSKFGLRVLLREYTHASDLPLVPGRYGALAWGTIAIGALLLLLWIVRPLIVLMFD